MLGSHANWCRDHMRLSERHVFYKCDRTCYWTPTEPSKSIASGRKWTWLRPNSETNWELFINTVFSSWRITNWSSVIGTRTWSSLTTSSIPQNERDFSSLLCFHKMKDWIRMLVLMLANRISARTYLTSAFIPASLLQTLRKYIVFCLKSYSIWALQCHKFFSNTKICQCCLSELLSAEKTVTYFFHTWLLFSQVAYVVLL